MKIPSSFKVGSLLRRRAAQSLLAGAALCSTAACGSDLGDSGGEGSVSVTIYGQEFVEQGIPATDFKQGWSVKFDRFLVTLASVELRDNGGTVEPLLKKPVVFDLVKPGEKTVVARSGIAAKNWPDFRFVFGSPSSGMDLGLGVTSADVQTLEQGNYVVYMSGTATKGSTTKTFKWGFSDPTLYSRCSGELTGQPVSGALIEAGKTDSIEITIHADHIFQDDLQSGSEKLGFEVIAQADKDGDGEVTKAELEAVPLESIDPAHGPFGTGSFTGVNNLWQYLGAASRALGHFRGEGHCDVGNVAQLDRFWRWKRLPVRQILALETSPS